MADEALFPGYREQVRFGALTIDGQGVWHYGNFAIVLKEVMISHRASVFEENSVMFMRHHNIAVWDADALPKGYRTTWAERHKVCLAKLADKLGTETEPRDYASILLEQGATPAEDNFVEVHIWGSLTRRTFERVVVRETSLRPAARVVLKDLEDQLEPMGVRVEMSV